MTFQVFISYKSEYRPFARALQARLTEWGYPSWLDVDNIRPGDYFRHRIQEGLDTSDVLVMILTEEAQQSREVMAEVDYFLGQQHKPVVPLRHQDCKPLYIFVSIQYIDFVADESSGFQALRSRLAELRDARTQPAPTTESPRPQPAAPSGLAPAPLPSPALPPAAPLQDVLVRPPAAAVEKRDPVAASPQRQPAPAPAKRSFRWPLLSAAALLLLVAAGLILIPPLTLSFPQHADQTQPALLPILLMGIGLVLGLAAILTLRRRAPTAAPAPTLAKPPAPPSPAPGSERDEGLADREKAELERAEEAIADFDDDALLAERGSLTPPTGAVLRHLDYGEYPLAGKPLLQVLDDLLGQMLLLGPAAARESALLELTAALRGRAAADSARPLPLRFSLAAAPPQGEPFEAGLQAALEAQHALTPSAARAWVQSGDLVLLVDDLNTAGQAAALTALQAYRRSHRRVDVVVAAAAADFDGLAQALDIRGAVLLPEQM